MVRESALRGSGTKVAVLRSVASEGILAWQLLASVGAGRCACRRAGGAGPWRNSKWSRGLKVGMSSSWTERLRRVRARRLWTAALPSANNSCASGVEHPRASTMGSELLLCLWVLGRGLAALAGDEDGRGSIVVREEADYRLQVMAQNEERGRREWDGWERPRALYEVGTRRVEEAKR